MCTIVYKPHCSICGAVINEKVAYRDVIVYHGSFLDMGQKSTEIFPGKCKRCGQSFTKIEIPMPEQLPTERIK